MTINGDSKDSLPIEGSAVKEEVHSSDDELKNIVHTMLSKLNIIESRLSQVLLVPKRRRAPLSKSSLEHNIHNVIYISSDDDDNVIHLSSDNDDIVDTKEESTQMNAKKSDKTL
ncbi:hypothetical protein QL285_001646 [Trifolium repens]|nr:hypothetical protein QL285_056825 [Trifolium repens]KAK2454044.1 hypothetical protein QL285_001646 [Trifolium repens]